MKKNNNETLLAYASVLRVPPHIAVPLVAHFQACLAGNGDEWTCSRFKSVKLDFIRLQAGLPMVSQWVAREANHFKGAFGGLQTWCSKNPKRWSSAIQLLQIYSTLIAKEVTPKQSKKFLDAVNSLPSESNTFDHYNNILLRGVKEWFPNQRWYSNPKSFIQYPVSSTRREPHANGKSYIEGEDTLACAFSFLSETIDGVNHIRKYPFLFGPLLYGVKEVQRNLDVHMDYYHDHVGKIGLIQEPGMKLRAVANPARVYQATLQPLGDSLYGILASLPWDCTFDQARPFVIIQKRLQAGNVVHATDLSNATDMFPFVLQTNLLNALYLRKDAIELFCDLSRADWRTTLSDQGFISWKRGQPLGLYPSFASFALTHGFMLYALNGFCHNDAFFVLGDDVVILNDDLQAKYLRFLSEMGIPFSADKTISSSLITEFGGKIILPFEIVPQLKWRHASDDNFIDLACYFGERFRKLMRSNQRKVFDVVKTIPEFLGGCGFNPAGIPLKTRIALYYSLQDTRNKKSYVLSYNGRLQQMNHAGDNLGSGWVFTTNPALAFEQNASFVALSMPIKFTYHVPINDKWCWRDVVGNPLVVVAPENRVLPVMGGGVRNTTLSVLEKKLGMGTVRNRNLVSLN